MGVLRTGVEATMTGAAGRAAGAVVTAAAAGALAAAFEGVAGRAMVESFPIAGGRPIQSSLPIPAYSRARDPPGSSAGGHIPRRDPQGCGPHAGAAGIRPSHRRTSGPGCTF